MSVYKLVTSALLLVVLCVCLVSSKRLRDRIYVPISPSETHFCFRRTNGTHQFGCTSDVGGNVGVVHVISDEEDLDWLIDKGPHDPYIAVLVPKVFSNDILLRIKESKKVAGIVLLHPDEQSSVPSDLHQRYSDDQVCPNALSDLYRDSDESCSSTGTKWNPGGSNNIFADLPFPIMYISDTDSVDVIVDECFNAFNKPDSEGNARGWPLCAMELSSHMFSSVDTKTCIRRNNIDNIVSPVVFCDALGDKNTFLFLEQRNDSFGEPQPGSVILLATRIDAMTMFDQAEVGADSPVTNIVAMLETARLLSRQKLPFDDGEVKNVLFAFFHGESFDYIGSSRFVYDMEEGLFPDGIDPEAFPDGQQPLLNLTHIRFVLELGQLFNVHSFERLFAHTDKQFDKVGLRQSLMSAARQSQLSMSVAGKHVLPPSSLHSILKKNRQVPGILLTDFEDEYTNNYYHSVYDGESNLGYNYTLGTQQRIVQHIAKVSETVASFVFEQVGGELSRIPTFEANSTLINEMLHCYIATSRCNLLRVVSDKSSSTEAPSAPFPQYVGPEVQRSDHGLFTRNLLVFLTGENIDTAESHHTRESCRAPEGQNIYEYVFLRGESPPEWWSGEPCNKSIDCGYCYKTLSFRRDAVSPAFVIEDYDYSDPKYAAWAESRWATVGARVFLKASPSLQVAHFSIGLLVFICSFLVVFWIDRYADEMFSSATDVTLSSERGSGSSSGTAATNTSRTGEPTQL